MALDLVARTGLLPLLLWQGAQVRRRALLLPEPPGPRQGVQGVGPPLRVLFLGDSSAAGVGAPHQAQALSGQVTQGLAARFEVDWQLIARTGATTRDALSWVDALPEQRIDVAILSLGVNDVTGMVPRRRWMRQQATLFETLTRRFGTGCILASGLPPMGHFPLLPQPLRWVLGAQAARLDRGLARLCAARETVQHIRVDYPNDPRYLAEDGYHASPLAYALWAGVLVRAMAA